MSSPSDSSPPRAAPEVRRRREGWIILATALAVVVFAVFETRLPQSTATGSVGIDAILVALINLNLILLVLLVFLVGRNIVKLFFERRRRIIGSHLRTKLVGAFVGIALLPATLLFFVALVFVGNSIEKWFNGQVENSLEGSLEVAHAYYQDLAGTALGFARQLAARVAAEGYLAPDHRMEGEGDDEIGTLVTAFNRRTADLKTSRTELESRRRYLEILLANVAAGVISADAEGRITTMNRAAESLLGLTAPACVGRELDDVFAGEAYAEVRQLAAELRAGSSPAGAPVCLLDEQSEPGTGRMERQLKLARDGHEAAVLLTGTRLLDEGGDPRGLLLFLEEVTHLLRVQRMEAWREVARRIAHEIKNPLTPIQLSAQRLRRRYATQLRDGGAVFDECTRTIIQQVEELKALVNEFSTFARMPAGEHTSQDLNRLVEEALVLFREGHRDIDFEFTPEPALPVLELDREGVKRAVINILDNAVAACAARRPAAPGERGRVELRTTYDARLDVARLEIADNGAGMSPEVKARLFEPYFSTKPDGTGLGLAIVSAIVADHNGFVRVRDNVPRGSRFVMEFPVRRQPVQLAVGGRHGAYQSA